MSIFDFSVSRDGYLVNEHTSEVNQELLSEGVCCVDNTAEFERDWGNRIRALGELVYNLQFNTDMRPGNLQDFEVLNSTIVDIAKKIAELSAYDTHLMNPTREYLIGNVRNMVQPYFLKLSANAAVLDNKIRNAGVSQTMCQLKNFGYSYQAARAAEVIQTAMNAGLSSQIIEPRNLKSYRDYDVVSSLAQYDSFSNMFADTFGELQNPKLPFITTSCVGEAPASDVINSAVRFPVDCVRDRIGSDDVIYGPYKTIAVAASQNLDEIYETGDIQQSTYVRLAQMAYTVVNLFNAFWMSSYAMASEVINMMYRREYVRNIITIGTADERQMPAVSAVPVAPAQAEVPPEPEYAGK